MCVGVHGLRPPLINNLLYFHGIPVVRVRESLTTPRVYFFCLHYLLGARHIFFRSVVLIIRYFAPL